MNSNNNQKLDDFLKFDQAHRMSELATVILDPNQSPLLEKQYPTGISGLDEILTGGFGPGIHVLGAISSAGKSSLVLQIASNMAEAGEAVIYLSLEAPASTMTGKMLSMYTYMVANHDESLAKSLSGIKCGLKANSFTDDELDVLKPSNDKLISVSQKITILQSSDASWDIDSFIKYVENYIDYYQMRPFVIIDYLQLMKVATRFGNMTDKQQVDYAVGKLRILADKHKIPILCISSFNRDNYRERASYLSYKESGAVEYSADTLLALQFENVGRSDFDFESEIAKSFRCMQLSVLKQRNGVAGQSINLTYAAAYNYFEEREQSFQSASARTRLK